MSFVEANPPALLALVPMQGLRFLLTDGSLQGSDTKPPGEMRDADERRFMR